MSNLGRPITNKNKVPSRMWRAWSNHARRVFNRTYSAMAKQHMNTAFGASVMPRAHWNAIRWNAAVYAACACDNIPYDDPSLSFSY